MAKLGRGTVAYLGLHDSATRIMEDFFERISHPALTDIRIDWGGMRVTEVFPEQIPDLFVGQPVILTGRYQRLGDAPIQISGTAAGEHLELAVGAHSSSSANRHPGLPHVWARMKIADLSDQSLYSSNDSLTEGIKQVALGSRLSW